MIYVIFRNLFLIFKWDLRLVCCLFVIVMLYILIVMSLLVFFVLLLPKVSVSGIMLFVIYLFVLWRIVGTISIRHWSINMLFMYNQISDFYKQQLMLIIALLLLLKCCPLQFVQLRIKGNSEMQANTTNQHSPVQQQTNEYRSELSKFLSFNKQLKVDSKSVKIVQQNLIRISQYKNFFTIAYTLMMNEELQYQALTLTSMLLKQKFKFDFEKIDSSEVNNLQQMIKNLIQRYKVSQNFIPQEPIFTFMSNISLCMSFLYIQRASQIPCILQYFRSYITNGASPNYFFKALQYVAEEVDSSKIVMDQDRKQLAKKKLKDNQSKVLIYLNSIANQLWNNSIVKKAHIFQCFKNWIQIGYNKQLFEQLPDHFIAQRLFQASVQQKFNEEATACLRSIILKLKVDQNPKLFQFLAINIFNLFKKVNQMIKNCYFTEADYCIQVICDFGVSSANLFIKNYNQNIEDFLVYTIQYMKCQDLEVMRNLSDFWENFIRQLRNQNAFNQTYFNMMKNLFAVTCFRVKYNWDIFQKLNEFSAKEISSFVNQMDQITERRQISEPLFQLLSLAMGKHHYLNFVLNSIKQLPSEQKQVFWPYFQAYLFSLKNSLYNYHQISEDIQILVNSYGQLQEQYKCVKNSYMPIFKALMTIKDLNNPKRQMLINHMFKLIAGNFSDPLLRDRAERTFAKGCQENPDILRKNIQDFMQLLKMYPGRQDIIKGISYALNSNSELMAQYLPQVLVIQYEIFKSADSVVKKKQSFHSLFTIFKTISQFKTTQSYQSTIRQFTKSILPYLLDIIKNPQHIELDEDPEVQRCAKLLKFIMRCLKHSFAQFLDQLFIFTLNSYRTYPICSYIYILEVAITVFYDNINFYDYFKNLYINFCQVTYAHFKNIKDVQDYQFLIDDFIGMNKRFYIYNSRIVLESGQLPNLIQSCISLSHQTNAPKVSKAAYQFFQTIFMVYWRPELIKQYNDQQYGDKFAIDENSENLYLQLKMYLLPKIKNILMKMISHLSEVPIQSTTQCLLDALVSQIKAFPNQNSELWESILIDIPLNILTKKQKQTFYAQLSLIGSAQIQTVKKSQKIIDSLIYKMNKRFINNAKRTKNL